MISVMDLDGFVAGIKPSETVLLLGAGASVPSGGMSGVDLARYLCDEIASGEVESDDLAEAASLLESRYGRPALVQPLADHLRSLRPDGGLLSLAGLPWPRAYTTNYDELVEQARREIGHPVEVVRTNLDFRKLDASSFELIKLHGCISRDRAYGHADSMLLTEHDYTEFSRYREALFAKLIFDLHTKDVLVLGHSLRDRHLRDLIDEVSARARVQGTSNRVKVLAYTEDPARIRLLEERGLAAASGTLADLTDRLRNRDVVAEVSQTVVGGPGLRLPGILLSRCISVAAAQLKQPSASRMFNGSSASYADIAAGLTFARLLEPEAIEYLANEKLQYLILLGAAGVGKTTTARRVLSALSAQGADAFEHVDEFPLNWQAWAELARIAKAKSRVVYLLIDEAFKHLTGVNRLVQSLHEDENTSLRLVLCAHSSSWEQRSKSGLLRRFGREETLSLLQDREIESLVDLIRSQQSIRTLLDPPIGMASRPEQIDLVKQQAHGDMFVALKYCFPGTSLDEIVLREFADLPEDVQEVYKIACLLEATYAHASRQIILEVLGLDWTYISTITDRSRGVLDQRLVDAREGLWVWRTRHPVIAQVIARFKYGANNEDELYYVLRKIVEALNAAMLLDRYIVPNLCDSEFAIGRLRDVSRRIELFEKLCERTTNRIPWHRLIATWLELDLATAEQVIRRAIAAVGLDSPIARYQVKAILARATDLQSLGTDDYVTLILDAETLARAALQRWPSNKYTYLSIGDVGEALMQATGSPRLVEEAIALIDGAYDDIFDDQMLRWRQRLESILN